MSHEHHKAACEDSPQQPPALPSTLPPHHFGTEGVGDRLRGMKSDRQGVPSRWSPLQGPGRFQGKATLSEEPGRAGSALGLWLWWPRLGLPSRTKKGQRCSAWALLPQPQMTRLQGGCQASPHRTSLGSHLGITSYGITRNHQHQGLPGQPTPRTATVSLIEPGDNASSPHFSKTQVY